MLLERFRFFQDGALFVAMCWARAARNRGFPSRAGPRNEFAQIFRVFLNHRNHPGDIAVSEAFIASEMMVAETLTL